MSSVPRHPARDSDLGELTSLALAAREGDRAALEGLCHGMPNPMYRLALRFTGAPVDAEDATQEIMIRLITQLGSFEGRARFTTWAYTVAVRHLMRMLRRPVEASVAGPEAFAAFIDQHAADAAWEPTTQVEYASCVPTCGCRARTACFFACRVSSAWPICSGTC